MMDTEMDDSAPSTSTTYVPPFGSDPSEHTHTVIFLHGREDFGSDVAKYFFDSKSSTGNSLAEIFPTIKWVFPTAKLRRSERRAQEFESSTFAEQLKGEEIISQWFDMWDVGFSAGEREHQELMFEGLREGIEQIIEIIREESAIVPLERIILGGISQGCAMAFFALMQAALEWQDMKLGGFIGLSSWLPFQSNFLFADRIQRQLEWENQGDPDREESLFMYDFCPYEILSQFMEPTLLPNAERYNMVLSGNNKNTAVTMTPVFLAHSQDDEIVPIQYGDNLRRAMQGMGFKVMKRRYEDGGHWIHPEQGVNDIATFLLWKAADFDIPFSHETFSWGRLGWELEKKKVREAAKERRYENSVGEAMGMLENMGL